MTISTKITEMTAQIQELWGFMKSAKEFRISPKLSEGVRVVSQLVKDGKNDDAVKNGAEVLRAGRAILGAFIRNSVVDQEATETSTFQMARFTKEIRRRAFDDDGPYDDDIIAKLEKKKEELLVMVRGGEFGPNFTERIRAYNAMVDALVKADEDQKRLDRTRAETARQKMKTAEVLASRPNNGQAQSSDRAEAIVIREKAAADLLAIL